MKSLYNNIDLENADNSSLIRAYCLLVVSIPRFVLTSVCMNVMGVKSTKGKKNFIMRSLNRVKEMFDMGSVGTYFLRPRVYSIKIISCHHEVDTVK